MNLILTNKMRDLPLAKNTGVHCRIRASNDAEAIERWLDEYFDKPTTFRTYKKEAERFLVWCVTAQNTSLFKLNREDVLAYKEFLKNPQPKEQWCGPRRKKLNDETWYPFAGPLSESAIKTAMAALNSLMNYLMNARYLDFNPFILVKNKSIKSNLDEQALQVQERILEPLEWQAILTALEQEPQDTPSAIFKKNRLRFLIELLFFLGLRIDELHHASWHDCRKIDGLWWFFVRGKGGKLGKIPINSHLMQSMVFYRHYLGLPPVPNGEAIPLIAGLNRSEEALTVRQMTYLIKDIATKAANQFAIGSISNQKLKRFSPHWLRHLSASYQDQAGISFTNIKSNLRHQNEQTTRIYVHAHDNHRHQEMEKLKLSTGLK